VLAVALLLGACGTSSEETSTTTTKVAAAAGSGFCLAWSRYQLSVSSWLLEPPETVDDAVTSAEATLRAAEEARSVAPDDLEEQLDVVVTTIESIEEAVGRADSLDDATTEAGSRFDSSDMTTATTAATQWTDLSC
jgi:hypothetical protein